MSTSQLLTAQVALVSFADKLFRSNWPVATGLLFGKRAVTIAKGAKHKNLRALITATLGLDNLKKYVPLVERVVLNQLGKWKDGSTVGAYGELKKVRALKTRIQWSGIRSAHQGKLLVGAMV
jgi:cytochrome P450